MRVDLWIDKSDNVKESYILYPEHNEVITYEIYRLIDPLYSERGTDTQHFYKMLARNEQGKTIFIGWGYGIPKQKQEFRNLDFCKRHCEEHWNFFRDIFEDMWC